MVLAASGLRDRCELLLLLLLPLPLPLTLPLPPCGVRIEIHVSRITTERMQFGIHASSEVWRQTELVFPCIITNKLTAPISVMVTSLRSRSLISHCQCQHRQEEGGILSQERGERERGQERGRGGMSRTANFTGRVGHIYKKKLSPTASSSSKKC